MNHTESSCRYPLLLLGAWIAAAPVVDAALAPEKFELRGKVLSSDGKPFLDVVPQVFLHGAVSPFNSRTMADRGGEFRFKNLEPGMYTLIIAVPRAGEFKKTVEIGPSQADSKRRVTLELTIDPDPTEEAHKVSLNQLSIPDKAMKAYEQALGRLEKRDIQGAVDHLNKAVEIYPEFAAAWNRLGTIAYQTQKYVEAEGYFRESLRHDADYYPPLVNLGGALLSQNRVPDSLPVNQRAVKANPGDALAHSQLGQSYFYLGKLDEAETHLRQAKALDPGHFSFPQLILAQIREQKHDYAGFIAELEELLRYHPDTTMAPALRDAIEKAGKLVDSRPRTPDR